MKKMQFFYDQSKRGSLRVITLVFSFLLVYLPCIYAETNGTNDVNQEKKVTGTVTDDAGEALTAVEEGTAIRLSVRSGAPVIGDDGEVLGAISVGYRLDTNTFVDTIQELMGCECSIVLDNERISTTVTNPDGTLTHDSIRLIVRGDLNSDATASPVDTLIISNHLAGRTQLTPTQTLAADLVIDQTISPVDLLKLRNYLAGRITNEELNQ